MTGGEEYLIRESTILAKDIELQEYKAELDSLCKKILSNKMILAWIMKSTMEEYEGYEVSDIAGQLIEGTPKISKELLHRDEVPDVSGIVIDAEFNGELNEATENNLTKGIIQSTISYVDERIIGQNTEDITVKEGKATFDIYFTSVVPDDVYIESESYVKDKIPWIKHYVNVEPQNKYNPGYPIVKRGVYYVCRMISSQYQKEFKNSDYEKLKKVYSVWVCTNPPKYAQNTITRYFICEENVVGDVKRKVKDYDFINVIEICLGDLSDRESHKKTDNKLLSLLNVLLSRVIPVNEKKHILENEFNIPMTVEMEGEMEEMCDYSDGIYEMGKVQGMVQLILNLMKTANLSKGQAMDMLMVPEEEREKCMKLL